MSAKFWAGLIAGSVLTAVITTVPAALAQEVISTKVIGVCVTYSDDKSYVVDITETQPGPDSKSMTCPNGHYVSAGIPR